MDRFKSINPGEGIEVLGFMCQNIHGKYSAWHDHSWDGGVVEDFGVVTLLNNPSPKSNNPKTGLLRLALDFGHPNPEIL